MPSLSNATPSMRSAGRCGSTPSSCASRAREQARETRLGQEHLLQQQRLAVRHAQALEVNDRRAHGDAERLGDDGLGGQRPCGDDARGRVVSQVVELFGERERPVEVEVDRLAGHERPAATCPLDPPLAG